MNLDHNKYLIALTHFPKFGPVRLKKIKKYFDNLEIAFSSDAQRLKQAGIEENVAYEFIAERSNINPDKIIEQMNKENIKIIKIEDMAYPKLLSNIYDPPQLLYYKGEISKQDEFSLAVVGTRKYTNYGKQAVEDITKDLVLSSITIVSGLALGIDALAHNAALEVNGRTIAVLGSGLDKQNIYPSSNRYLADKILATNGAIVSEFPIGTPPLRHHFPQRNRLISGLTLGVLIIEAGENSGALITAYHALEQNREVFAVPGTIYSPSSQGTNYLLKQGSHLVTSARDILEILDLKEVTSFMKSKKIIPETEEEKQIIVHLTNEPIHVDELIRLTKLDTAKINSTLTIMEMKGMVKNLGGMQYVLAR